MPDKSRVIPSFTMENFMREAGKCGNFQIYHVAFVQLCRFFIGCSLALMIFGLYDPGWQCQQFNSTTIAPKSISKLWTATASYGADNYTTRPGILPAFSLVSENKQSSYDNAEAQKHFNNSDVNVSNDSHLSWRETYSATCDVIDSCEVIRFNPSSSTIITEFGLVCNKVWIAYLIVSVLNVGMLVGAFAWGQIGELCGRKLSMYIANVVVATACGLAILSPMWEVYAVFTFFIGFGAVGANATLNVLTMEFLSSRWRARVLSIPVWNVGILCFAVATYLLRDWKLVHMAVTAGCCLSCVGIFWTSESLRWLVVHGKTERAENVVNKMAKRNKTPLQMDSLKRLMDAEGNQAQDGNRHYTYIDLFKTRELCLLTLKLSFIRVMVLFVYELIGFGIQALPGDFYTNVVMATAVEVPSVLISGPMANRFGRRRSGIVFTCVGTLSCIVVVTSLLALEKGNVRDILVTSLALINRSAVEGLMNVMISYSAELMPTSVRNLSFGFTEILGRVAGVAGPYLLPRDHPSMVACFSVLMTLQITATGVFTSLHETKGSPLRDTVAVITKPSEL